MQKEQRKKPQTYLFLRGLPHRRKPVAARNTTKSHYIFTKNPKPTNRLQLSGKPISFGAQKREDFGNQRVKLSILKVSIILLVLYVSKKFCQKSTYKHGHTDWSNQIYSTLFSTNYFTGPCINGLCYIPHLKALQVEQVVRHSQQKPGWQSAALRFLVHFFRPSASLDLRREGQKFSSFTAPVLFQANHEKSDCQLKWLLNDLWL